METIEKLTVQEALAAKGLWAEIFFEDSDRFTAYYFAEKMKDNTGYGLKCGGTLRAMLFLTPYMGRILSPDHTGTRFQEVPLCYIVGVGTKKEYRHRGYMDRLLRYALAELQAAGQPFTFLMPADPAIYAPYQFRYIYERPVFAVPEKGKSRAAAMEAGEEAALAAFAEAQLEKRYQLFLHRDASYYSRQKKESLAQNGDVYIWKENGKITGFYLYAREGEKEEIQEAVVSDDFAETGVLHVSENKQPVIMARITNVQAMLSLMRLSEKAGSERITVRLKISDPLIPENNGTFLWTVGKKESTIALSDEADRADVCAEIGDLAELLFGRKSCAGAYERLSGIETLSRIFLNEIV